MRRAVALAGALLLACACGGRPQGGAEEVRRLSIATGPTAGVYYVYGGALARVLSRDLPGVEATAEVTSASGENLHFLGAGSADVASVTCAAGASRPARPAAARS